MNSKLDLDPRPSKSPRLYAEVEDVPGSRKSSEVSASRMTHFRLRRLRYMAIIEACRSAEPPVPWSTLVETLNISRSQADRLLKLARRRKLRVARV